MEKQEAANTEGKNTNRSHYLGKPLLSEPASASLSVQEVPAHLLTVGRSSRVDRGEALAWMPLVFLKGSCSFLLGPNRKDILEKHGYF